MLSYELCKKLKDAGFKFNTEIVDEFKCVCGHKHTILKDGVVDVETGDSIIIPTLKELIEACGGEFESLNQWYPPTDKKLQWQAQAIVPDGIIDDIYNNMCIERTVFGKSPEEAVANLYLTLNKK